MELKEVYNAIATLELDELYKVRTELSRQIKGRGSRQFDQLKIGDKVEVVKGGVLEFKGTVVEKRRTRLLVKDDATERRWSVPPEMVRKVS